MNNRYPPDFIGLDDYGGWMPNPLDRDDLELWRRTSHAWARRNKLAACWLYPHCAHCVPYFLFDERCWSEHEAAHDECAECGKGPIPYRRVQAVGCGADPNPGPRTATKEPNHG